MSHMFPPHTHTLKSLHRITLFQWQSANALFFVFFFFFAHVTIIPKRLENICELCLSVSQHEAEYLKHIFCCQQHLSHHQHQTPNTLSFAFWNHAALMRARFQALLQALGRHCSLTLVLSRRPDSLRSILEPLSLRQHMLLDPISLKLMEPFFSGRGSEAQRRGACWRGCLPALSESSAPRWVLSRGFCWGQLYWEDSATHPACGQTVSCPTTAFGHDERVARLTRYNCRL